MNLSVDENWMQRAIELAAFGQGHVEPNPMVGCVLVRDGELIGEGAHRQYGQAHAEVNALASCSDPLGATAYVTLEPCCHQGKTGPCTDALIAAKVARVVIAMTDPFAAVAGKGIEKLVNAGIDVNIGVCGTAAQELNRPYVKRIQTGKPWVIAKWAMTLDGRIASSTGSSQWISNEQSRAVVHQLRGRVDAIIVGIGTALADDPLLTARPSGRRVAKRIVLDSGARLDLQSKLVTTASESPTMVAVSQTADEKKCRQLLDAGCEVVRLNSADYVSRFDELLSLLGQSDMTNVLVEGGGGVFGSLHDGNMIDEVHCFIGPKLIGGDPGYSPVGGAGKKLMDQATSLRNVSVTVFGDDVCVQGRT